MSAPVVNHPGFASALHEALRSTIAELRRDGATLAEDIAAASDDALPAIEAALQARRQKALDPQARKHLLAEAARLPVQRCIEFSELDDDDGVQFAPTLTLARPKYVRVLVGAETQEAHAVSILRNVADLIESGALHERDWSDAYKRAGTSLDDETPY